MKNTVPIFIAEVKRQNPKPAWCVRWADPRFNQIFAVAYYDQSVVVYQLLEDKKVNTLYSCDMNSSVNKLDFAPWGFGLKLVAVNSEGGGVLIYRDNTKFEKIEFNCHDEMATCVSWAPACTLDHFLDPKSKKTAKVMFATGGCDKKIRVWEYSKSTNSTGVNIIKHLDIDAHESYIRDISWSNNGYNNNLTLASGGEDKVLKIWRIEYKDGGYKAECVWKKEFDSPIWKVSFNYSGNLLAVAYTNSQDINTVEIYAEKEKNKWEQISQTKNPN